MTAGGRRQPAPRRGSTAPSPPPARRRPGAVVGWRRRTRKSRPNAASGRGWPRPSPTIAGAAARVIGLRALQKPGRLRRSPPGHARLALEGPAPARRLLPPVGDGPAPARAEPGRRWRGAPARRSISARPPSTSSSPAVERDGLVTLADESTFLGLGAARRRPGLARRRRVATTLVATVLATCEQARAARRRGARSSWARSRSAGLADAARIVAEVSARERRAAPRPRARGGGAAHARRAVRPAAP